MYRRGQKQAGHNADSEVGIKTWLGVLSLTGISALRDITKGRMTQIIVNTHW